MTAHHLVPVLIEGENGQSCLIKSYQPKAAVIMSLDDRFQAETAMIPQGSSTAFLKNGFIYRSIGAADGAGNSTRRIYRIRAQPMRK